MISTILTFLVALVPFFSQPEGASPASAQALAAPEPTTETFLHSGAPEVTLTVRSTGTNGEITWELKNKDEVLDAGVLIHVHGSFYKMEGHSSLGMLVVTEYGCVTTLVEGENPGHVAHWIKRSE